MKAAYIRSPGPPENIEIGDLPVQQLEPWQVRVQVAAATPPAASP